MASAKKTQIVITANAAVAKKVMDELQQRIDGIKQKMAALDTTTSQGQKEFKKLEKELVSYNSAVAQNVTNTERIDKAMKNLAGTSLNELKRALSAAKSELGKMSANDKGLKQMQGNVKALQGQIDKLTGSVHKQGGAWQTAMKNLTAYVGLFTMFNKAKELVTGAIRKNFEYSGSLTDIRKVSGLAMEDINQLSRELAKIDTRTSVDALAQLAYEGAKLGMGQYGVEGMAGFVRAADKINVAIGEEMGKEALPALSKLVETMGLIPKMGIEKAMDATGSAMFKLSASSTATSGNIVEFAKRLTGVARTAGITTDQLLALGSASDSMYLMPEVASTAMSKFIVALQRNHNLIEKDLGIQQGTIKNMYAAGNAMDAIVLVLEKMKQTGNMNALGGIFKDLGSDGQRLVTAMVTMSKNVDMLKDHLEVSNEAFREGQAVTTEYEMQQKSAIGILERANNLWEKAFVNPEGVDNVKALAEAWYNTSKFLTENKAAMGTFNVLFQMLIVSCETLVRILPALLSALMFKGVSAALIGLRNSFVGVSDMALIATLRTEGLNAAWKKLSLSMKSNWISLVIGLLVQLGVTLYEVFKKTEDVADAQLDVNKYVEEGSAAWEKERRKLDSYVNAVSSANTSTEQRKRLIQNFNKEYRPYLDKLGLEVNSVNTLKGAYSKLNDEIRKKMFYQIREKAYDTELGKSQGEVGKAIMDYSKYINSEKGSNWAAFDTKYLAEQVAKGKNAMQIYHQIIESTFGSTGTWTGSSHEGDEYILQTGTVKDFALKTYISNYVKAQKGYMDTKGQIDKALNPLVGDYDAFEVDDPGTLENDAPDKKALAEAKRQRQEQQRSWREELKQKQDEANAIMDNVRNFYERQINEKLSQAIASGMDKTEQDLFVEPVKRRMNEALQQVRLAIAGQKNSWEEFKATMNSDLIEQTDETGINLSQGLLNDITSNNVEALRKKMEQLGNSLKRPMNSITAEIFAKATKNEQSNLKLEAQQMETRRKVAQENDYTGAVKQNMYDDFNTMGYANPTDAETADKAAFDARKKNILDMYEKARTEIATLYTIDVSSTNGQGLLMQFLFGEDPDGMAARIKEVLKDNTADWQAFYNKLIQYSDDYAAAEKKVYDQQKRISDQMWAVNKRNLANQAQLRKMQEGSNLFGKRTNYLSNLGLKDLTTDPEVELMKARMQAAEDYYAFIEKNYRNKQLLDDADKARQEAELAYANQMATAMKNRLSQLKELVQPIETFGEAVGEALGEMTSDAESANEAIKSALKSMLQSWGKMAINSINTQMWKAVNDAGVKRARKKTQPDIKKGRIESANAVANGGMSIPTDLGSSSNPVHAIIDAMPLSSLGKEGDSGNPTGIPFAENKDYKNVESVSTDHSVRSDDATATLNTSPLPAASFAGVSSQAGSAVADVVTGQSSFGGAAAGIVGDAMASVVNMDFVSKKTSKEEKERKKQLKAERKHQKELSREAKKGIQDRERTTERGVENITKTTEEGNKEQSKGTQIAQDTIMNATDAALNATLTAKKKNNDETLQSDAQRTQGEVTFSIAGAMAKCFEFLGPIAGPIAAAVVMSTLMGLLQWALSSAMGGGKKNNSSSNSKSTKIVSGMLTYDSGNVQDLKPFVGDDGKMYWAEENNAPNSGVNLLTTPTATIINGQRSLVAENGPELVIGRETTKAMMMYNPSLLKALVNYDSNYSGRTAARRTFDKGNLSELEMDGTTQSATQAGAQANATGTADATNAALLQAVTALITRLEQPITAQVNMFGRGQLYESLNKAKQFVKGK